MTTRFNVKSKGLRSGYDNSNYSPDLSIPSCGIEDVDLAIFNLFDKEIPFQVRAKDGLKGANVIFAAGEKWAIIKKKKEIRDRQGRLILPLVTIGRTSITQDSAADIAGRGINQQTGELRIVRRLYNGDRNYQNLINRLFLQNQLNVAINPDQGVQPLDGQLTTQRQIGDLANVADVAEGSYMIPIRDNNVWETLTIPAPQFFTARYEVTFWTQYTVHMNELIEMFIAAQLPQGNAFKIKNPEKNYWFIATIEGNEYTPENNFENMFEQERIIKYTFNVNVPGYVIATNVPGAPVPVRRYVSSTNIEFQTDIGPIAGTEETTEDDPWLGVDDPTLPMDHQLPQRRLGQDHRRTGHHRLQDRNKVNPDDPALLSYPRGTVPAKYMNVQVVNPDGSSGVRRVKLKTVNPFSGESTFSAEDLALGGLTLVVNDE